LEEIPGWRERAFRPGGEIGAAQARTVTSPEIIPPNLRRVESIQYYQERGRETSEKPRPHQLFRKFYVAMLRLVCGDFPVRNLCKTVNKP
jgi:hypothetical protein